MMSPLHSLCAQFLRDTGASYSALYSVWLLPKDDRFTTTDPDWVVDDEGRYHLCDSPFLTVAYLFYMWPDDARLTSFLQKAARLNIGYVIKIVQKACELQADIEQCRLVNELAEEEEARTPRRRDHLRLVVSNDERKI